KKGFHLIYRLEGASDIFPFSPGFHEVGKRIGDVGRFVCGEVGVDAVNLLSLGVVTDHAEGMLPVERSRTSLQRSLDPDNDRTSLSKIRIKGRKIRESLDLN